MHKFLTFILGMKLYMFRAVPLSVIRSFPLYTAMVYVKQVCSTAVSKLVHLVGFIISK